MFNVFAQTGLPGFRVRPQDDVPGFDIDENGMPRRDAAAMNRTLPNAAYVPVSDPPANGIPPAANDNRHYVCTTAAYNCIEKMDELPAGPERMTARDSCLKAESMCNYIMGLAGNGPFPRGMTIRFPDGSRVEVAQGSTGGASYIPAPPNYPIQR
jgi:hypothetical protein